MPVTKGQGNPDWTRDETILALDLLLSTYPKVPGKTSKPVRNLSKVLRRLPIHADESRNERFRNPHGVYLKLMNLQSMHPDKAGNKGLSTSKMDRAIWEDLAHKPAKVKRLAEAIARGVDVIETEGSTELLDPDEEFEANEGTTLTKVHRVRERKRGFRRRVLNRVQKKHGKIVCECCMATPPRITGNKKIDAAMFEVHHLVPLAEAAKTKTRLADLALLCANCHRLIHAAMRAENRNMSVRDLKKWRKS